MGVPLQQDYIDGLLPTCLSTSNLAYEYFILTLAGVALFILLVVIYRLIRKRESITLKTHFSYLLANTFSMLLLGIIVFIVSNIADSLDSYCYKVSSLFIIVFISLAALSVTLFAIFKLFLANTSFAKSLKSYTRFETAELLLIPIVFVSVIFLILVFVA